MTCRVSSCNYQFCWVCLGDWAAHGSATGGHYKCNKYEEMVKSDKNLKIDNSDISERMYMESKNINKIWDCGKIKFEIIF